MDNRLLLHDELLRFATNVYFQPPSDIRMSYPCIVYHKTSPKISHANDSIYSDIQEYQLTVMDFNPDTDLTSRIISHFRYATPGDPFVVDRLNQFPIKLYY